MNNQINSPTYDAYVRSDASARRGRWHSFSVLAVSPLFLVLANLGLVFIAIIFPPQLFSDAAKEPDLIFLNAPFALLAVMCSLAFAAGIVLYRFTRGSNRLVFQQSPHFISTFRLVAKTRLLLRICLFINVITAILLLYGIGIHRFYLSLSDPTTAIAVRDQVLIVGRVFGINILALQNMILLILVLSFFIFISCPEPKIRGRFKIEYVGALVSYVIVCLLTITRWPILQLFFASLLMYILHGNGLKGMGIKKMAKIGMFFILVSIAIFLGIGIFKYGPSHVLDSIIGYTIASYNLGAAVLSGTFPQPYSDSTFVSLGFFWEFPFFGEYLRHIGHDFGLNLPVTGVANMHLVNTWAQVVADHSNLNPHWLWTTVYANLYADVGWFALIVFLLYGFISQYLYENFVRVRFFHVSLYAFFFVFQITWFTSVFISNTVLDDWVVFTLLLSAYLGRSWNDSKLPAGKQDSKLLWTKVGQ